MVYSMQTTRGLCCKFCIFIYLAINFLNMSDVHMQISFDIIRAREFEYLKILIITLHMNSIICSSRFECVFERCVEIVLQYTTYNTRSTLKSLCSLLSFPFSHAL